MAEGSDVHYWWLVFIGAMVLGAVLLFFSLRKKPREEEMNDPVSNQGARDVYAEEQRRHQNEPGSGL